MAVLSGGGLEGFTAHDVTIVRANDFAADIEILAALRAAAARRCACLNWRPSQPDVGMDRQGEPYALARERHAIANLDLALCGNESDRERYAWVLAAAGQIVPTLDGPSVAEILAPSRDNPSDRLGAHRSSAGQPAMSTMGI